MGNHLHDLCPRWLVLVEGVGDEPGAKEPAGQFTTDTFFRGENLMGVMATPVHLKEQSKLVYSPHLFGPDVIEHDYFEDRHFPENLEATWQRHFDYIPFKTGQPILVGAFLARKMCRHYGRNRCTAAHVAVPRVPRRQPACCCYFVHR